MTAVEWGHLTDGGDMGGDAQLGTAWCRAFLTASPSGHPVVVTVYAYAALVSPGDDPDDPAAMRDVLEHTEESTYLHGADPIAGDAEPFDSETTYRWAVDYWPRDAIGPDGQPTLEALDATARVHLRTLPQAWLDAMPDPPAYVLAALAADTRHDTPKDPR